MLMNILIVLVLVGFECDVDMVNVVLGFVVLLGILIEDLVVWLIIILVLIICGKVELLVMLLNVL